MREITTSHNRMFWIRKSLRDLWKYKGRAFPIIILVFMSIAGPLTLMQMGHNLSLAQSVTYDRLKLGNGYINTFPVNSSFAFGTIAQWKNDYSVIVDIQPRIFLEGQISLPNGDKIPVHVIGLPSTKRAVVNDIFVSDGSYFPDYSINNGAFVDSLYLEKHNWDLGQQLEVNVDALYTGVTKNFTIEILQGSMSPEYSITETPKTAVMEFGLLEAIGINIVADIFVRLDYLQDEVFGAEVYNQFCIRLQDQTQASELIQELKNDYDINAFVHSVRLFPTMIRELSNLFTGISWSFGILILAVTVLVVYMVTNRFVDEQRSQIAILKSLGYRRSEILRMYLNYGIIISFLGGIPGVIVGELLSYPFTVLGYGLILFPYQIFSTNWLYPVALLGFNIVFILLTTLTAARKAASIPPKEALQRPILQSPEKEPLFERVTHFLFGLDLSPLYKFQLRMLFNRPKRSFFTLAGIILSVMLIGAGTISIANINAIGESMLENESWDLQATFLEFQDWQVVKSDVESVLESNLDDQIEPFLIDFATIYAENQWNEVLFTAYLQNTTLKSFNGISGFLNEDSAILSQDVANSLELEVGSEFEIKGRNQTIITLSVQDILSENVLGIVYLPIDSGLLLSFGDQASIKANGVMIKGSDVIAAKDQIENITYVKEIISRADLIAAINEFFGLAIIGIGLVFIIALIIGASMVFGIMSINISERRNDLITFRALGVRNKEIIGSLLAETLVLGIIGSSIGYFMGWLAGSWLNDWIYSLISFPSPQNSFSIILILPVTLLVFLEIFIGQFGALKFVLNETIAEATREKVIE
ncbi:MAG: ABC transporter permease [Candidatus Hermodarchaeota archaeon]